jgi:hypothetical protein
LTLSPLSVVSSHPPAAPPTTTTHTRPQGVKIAPACEAAGVKAFPTWVINGNITEGQLDLNGLEALLAADSSSSSSEAAAVAAAAQ